MIKLQDRRKPGPNGFMYHEKRTNWKSWEADPVCQWDFDLLCSRYRDHARANPRLALETDIEKIRSMMDFANAARYARIQGADPYYVRTGATPKRVARPQPSFL